MHPLSLAARPGQGFGRSISGGGGGGSTCIFKFKSGLGPIILGIIIFIFNMCITTYQFLCVT